VLISSDADVLRAQIVRSPLDGSRSDQIRFVFIEDGKLSLLYSCRENFL